MQSKMTIDASVVFHYLYGYQTMRLASQDEVKAVQISVADKEPPGAYKEINRSKELKAAKFKQEETTIERKIKLPDGVALCISSIPGAKFGACSLKNIPAGTWFGPFEGKLVRRNETIDGTLSEFMWEIFHDGEVSHFLDGHTQNTWMSFVKCARHKKEQNMVVFQYHGCIYYRTTRELTPGSELLVWYDAKYTQFLGLPLSWNDNKSSGGKRKGTNSFNCENARRKRPHEDGRQEPLIAQKHVESQLFPLQKKKKVLVTEPCEGARGYCSTESRMPINGNGVPTRHGTLYTHAVHGNKRGISPNFAQNSYPICPISEGHGLQNSHSFPTVYPGKWREYKDQHYWQDQVKYVEGHFNHKPHFEYHQSRHGAEVTGCKNSTLPHPIALPSQVHRCYNYYQYNMKGHEETHKPRDIKEGCLPGV